jgi:hypothetical protein
MTGQGCLTYEFRVDGHLDDHWAAWLENLTLVRLDDGTSTLTGAVEDQSQLHGLLGRLRDIGATLLSVRALDIPSRPAQGSGAERAPADSRVENRGDGLGTEGPWPGPLTGTGPRSCRAGVQPVAVRRPVPRETVRVSPGSS